MTIISDVLSLVESGVIRLSDIYASLPDVKRHTIRASLSRLKSKGLVNHPKKAVYRKPHFSSRKDHPPPEPDFDGQEYHTYYLSGLQCGRNIGVMMRTESDDIEEVEIKLRDYCIMYVDNYQPDFYGISEVDDRNDMEIGEIYRVNL